MKTRNLLGILGIIVLAGACVPSVNPFYTEKDVVFDARLVGEWQTKGDTNDIQTWKFDKAADNAYTLLVTEKDHKQGKLDVHLFKIGGQLFLDLIPNDVQFSPEQAGIVGAAMFPGHLLLRVPRVEPALQLASCDYDWLAKYLEAHPEALPHHKEGNSLVLTAQTKELQAFVTRHLAEMFGKPEDLARQPAK